jgi:hypothetical protein
MVFISHSTGEQGVFPMPFPLLGSAGSIEIGGELLPIDKNIPLLFIHGAFDSQAYEAWQIESIVHRY